MRTGLFKRISTLFLFLYSVPLWAVNVDFFVGDPSDYCGSSQFPCSQDESAHAVSRIGTQSVSQQNILNSYSVWDRPTGEMFQVSAQGIVSIPMRDSALWKQFLQNLDRSLWLPAYEIWQQLQKQFPKDSKSLAGNPLIRSLEQTAGLYFNNDFLTLFKKLNSRDLRAHWSSPLQTDTGTDPDLSLLYSHKKFLPEFRAQMTENEFKRYQAYLTTYQSSLNFFKKAHGANLIYQKPIVQVPETYYTHGHNEAYFFWKRASLQQGKPPSILVHMDSHGDLLWPGFSDFVADLNPIYKASSLSEKRKEVFDLTMKTSIDGQNMLAIQEGLIQQMYWVIPTGLKQFYHAPQTRSSWVGFDREKKMIINTGQEIDKNDRNMLAEVLDWTVVDSKDWEKMTNDEKLAFQKQWGASVHRVDISIVELKDLPVLKGKSVILSIDADFLGTGITGVGDPDYKPTSEEVNHSLNEFESMMQTKLDLPKTLVTLSTSPDYSWNFLKRRPDELFLSVLRRLAPH